MSYCRWKKVRYHRRNHTGLVGRMGCLAIREIVLRTIFADPGLAII